MLQSQTAATQAAFAAAALTGYQPSPYPPAALPPSLTPHALNAAVAAIPAIGNPYVPVIPTAVPFASPALIPQMLSAALAPPIPAIPSVPFTTPTLTAPAIPPAAMMTAGGIMCGSLPSTVTAGALPSSSSVAVPVLPSVTSLVNSSQAFPLSSPSPAPKLPSPQTSSESMLTPFYDPFMIGEYVIVDAINHSKVNLGYHYQSKEKVKRESGLALRCV